ncbi:TRAP transporter small permease [Salipiger sp. IMCC34102]|uniref:TRAP transporter small permease n=1 Tax=Salipiger sp. IMCC34102 TaxID=2510647 RepID=UPI00101E1DF6|nr:TRAP transporter small permease [Salipiger sp. IMCC34102]RYH02126.1 TRAP transporter small permease [Salipiger sp. IMCC34102]
MRATIARAVHATARLPLWIAAASLFAMMALTFADVILRSFANAPIPGAAEVTEILLAATVFAALPATSLWGRHIAVDLFDGYLFARRRDGLVNLIFGILLFWPVAKCLESASRTMGYGEVTLYLRVPVGWILYFIAVALALSAAAMVLRGVFILFVPRIDPDLGSRGVTDAGATDTTTREGSF